MPSPSSSLFLLAAQFDARVLLSLEEACGVMGISIKTGYNWISMGAFPLPIVKRGNRVMIDIRDLAEYLDKERESARVEYDKDREKTKA